MSTSERIRTLVTITDLHFRQGYEEALEPYYADCRLRTDLAIVDAIRSMLTEIAEEDTLTEQQLWRNTGFIVGMLSKER